MILFLGIQGTYHQIHVGLFKDNTLLNSLTILNADASKQLIPTINALLHAHALSLECLSFIAATQGPGPFTTLRVILTTVNSINFARSIPLIGIDSLKTIAHEWEDHSFPCTVTLLDAFNNDVYFYIHQTHSTDLAPITNQQNSTGYNKIDTVLDTIAQHHQLLQSPIRFIGNATNLYKEKIKTVFASHAYFPTPLPTSCSLLYMGQCALEAWHKKRISTHLLPLYLKKHHAEIAHPLP